MKKLFLLLTVVLLGLCSTSCVMTAPVAQPYSYYGTPPVVVQPQPPVVVNRPPVIIQGRPYNYYNPYRPYRPAPHPRW